MRRTIAVAVGVALAATTTAVACTRHGGSAPRRSTTSTSAPIAKGGVARVAVWGEPDPGAPTLAGAGVRALVLPQLFLAGPKGEWLPSLVKPGSNHLAPDAHSATFAFRAGAAWSDGSLITVDDLRRTADARFVSSVDAAADGAITAHFTSALPGWQRLWSGTDSIAAPRAGVWGGPFVVAAVTPGLETVLHPNPGWKGEGPYLDEVRLVLVPDPTTARQLLGRGEIDVMAPLAETNGIEKLSAVGGATVKSTAAAGGWWVGLFLNPQKLDDAHRAAVIATFDRRRFVQVLMRGEALPLDGLAGAEDGTWSTVGKGDPSALKAAAVDLVGELEEPMTPLAHRSMQKVARGGGGRLELRQAEADRVEGWVSRGEYDAAVVAAYDGPAMCWTCRWAAVDGALASSADAGDRNASSALERALRDRGVVVPLWRPRAVVGWRAAAIAGPTANPYALNAAWDAWRWSRPPSGARNHP